MSNKNYDLYKAKMAKIADVQYATSVLNWDQEVFMPENSASLRGQQLSTLTGIAHEMFTSNQIGDLLNNLKEDGSLDFRQKANIKETLKSYNKATKLPEAFVIKMSQSISKAFVSWQKAKEANDFKLFEKDLSKIVDLSVEKAELYGFENHIYDALLDEYEPNSTVKELDVLFTDVKNELVKFVANIKSKQQVDDSFMFKNYNKDLQWNYGIDILKQMGYDFKSGRQDISTHPFTTTFSPNDVRVTTRVDENNLSEMMWSCIHEGGHALYEQGFVAEDYGLPSSNAISLGIHESQSRLWENNVGRSLPFWKHNYPQLQNLFKDNLGDVKIESFYKAMNKVESSLIRTNADELTYHFHILIRYEIEKALIEGSIAVAELPEVWNEKYKNYLGIEVPNDAKGVLQDIHWSHGSFGYFPTYSVGSFYAAQFYNQAELEIENLEEKIQKGDCRDLLQWLRTKIHQHGMVYSAKEICKKITGEPLNFKHFMNYATKKYGDIYNF